MRTGAAGVLVGFGGGAASTTRATLGIHAPMATAVADVAGARRDYLDESGGRYVHVIADGGVGTSGDIVKALAMGADAVMLGVALARATDAPGRGFHWGPEAHHAKLPRGTRMKVEQLVEPRVGALRPGAGRRRHREPHRGAAQVDGHDRVLRPQGVPARRGRRRAVQRRMTDSGPTDRLGRPARGPPTPDAPRSSRRRCARSCCARGGSRMLALCLVVAGVFAWLGQWQLGPRGRRPSPTEPGATEQVQPLADVVAPGEYLPEPLVGQQVDRLGQLDARRLPRRRVAAQRRRRGLLGHRAAPRRRTREAPSRSRRRRDRVGGDARMTRSRSGREARGRGIRRLADAARRHRPAHLGRGPGSAAARRGPADHDADVAGRAARAVARHRGPRRLPPLPRRRRSRCRAARRHPLAGARPRARASTGSTSSTRSSGRSSPASRSTSGTASRATRGSARSRSSRKPRPPRPDAGCRARHARAPRLDWDSCPRPQTRLVPGDPRCAEVLPDLLDHHRHDAAAALRRDDREVRPRATSCSSAGRAASSGSPPSSRARPARVDRRRRQPVARHPGRARLVLRRLPLRVLPHVEPDALAVPALPAARRSAASSRSSRSSSRRASPARCEPTSPSARTPSCTRAPSTRP